MLQIYKKYNKSTITVDPDIIFEGYDFADHWIHMSNPTDKEIELIARATGVAEDMIKAALDEEERARVEKDDDTGAVLVVTDIPFTVEDENHYTYTTLPFGFISTSDAMITVCLEETSLIDDMLSARFVKDVNLHKRTRFLIQLQYTISKKFLHYLKQIDRASQRVQNELEKSMRNAELIEMLDLEKSLVYISTSLRSNSVVLDRLPKSVKFFEEDLDLWEDVVIENKQAIEMSNIYRDILSGTMDAFASVISNNLNIVMKVLASVTIILTIPSIIFGLWGSNVPVPFETSPYGFWIVIAIAVLFTGAAVVWMLKKKWL